jgi:hypothetical protein
MSLEQVIEANTAAITKLAEAIAQLVGNQAPSANIAGAAAQAEEPKPKVKKAPAAATQEQKADPAPVVEPEVEPEVAKVTYEDCAAAITKLAKAKGRAAAVELLNSYGAEKLPDVKDDPKKLTSIKAAADKALALED